MGWRVRVSSSGSRSSCMAANKGERQSRRACSQRSNADFSTQLQHWLYHEGVEHSIGVPYILPTHMPQSTHACTCALYVDCIQLCMLTGCTHVHSPCTRQSQGHTFHIHTKACASSSSYKVLFVFTPPSQFHGHTKSHAHAHIYTHSSLT